MHVLLRSMTARLLLAAAGSAAVAVFVFVVNPFPSGVYGQTVPGSTLPNAATVPVAERTTTEAAPVTTATDPPAAGTTATDPPAAGTTAPAAPAGTTTSPVTNTTTSPATGSTAVAAAPVVAPARQVTVAQQPVALPRTGTGGLDADSDMSTGVAYGFLALAAALATAAVVHRVRRAR
ncbi:MAG: hypothetical protein ACRDJ9_12130 [Dehalococcoidia bacterium]